VILCFSNAADVFSTTEKVKINFKLVIYLQNQILLNNPYAFNKLGQLKIISKASIGSLNIAFSTPDSVYTPLLYLHLEGFNKSIKKRNVHR
jgi:hypothetical protein